MSSHVLCGKWMMEKNHQGSSALSELEESVINLNQIHVPVTCAHRRISKRNRCVTFAVDFFFIIIITIARTNTTFYFFGRKLSYNI